MRKCTVCHEEVSLEESLPINEELGWLNDPPTAAQIPLEFDDEYWWLVVAIPDRDFKADVVGIHRACIDSFVRIPFEALLPYENAWDKLPSID